MADINELVKSTVQAMSNKTDSKVEAANAEMKNTIITEVKETVVKEVIKEGTGGVDISGLATKDELNTKADNTSLNDKVDKSALFTQNGKGVFSVGWSDADGSTHRFEAEAGDFGGIFGYNANNNTSSYVGLNKSPQDFSDVDIQLYAKDKTSNIGTRINISNTKGMYYLKDSTNLGFPAEREVAVKGDLPDTSLFATKEELDNKADTSTLFKNGLFYVQQKDEDGSYNNFWHEKNSGGGNQYYNAKTNTISYLGVNKNPGFDETGKSKDIDVQIYAKDKTSNIGTRVNITSKEGMFYLKNSTNLGLPADREVAVIADINALVARIEALEARVAALENQ